MGGHEAGTYWEDAGLMLLVAGFIAGPLAWFLDLQISYAMIKWTCEHDRGWMLMLVSAGSLSLLALGTSFSWSCWTKLRRDAAEDGARMIDRSYFLAIAGLSMNAIFALLIFASLVPRIVLSPCE
jgi:hypothetical protein